MKAIFSITLLITVVLISSWTTSKSKLPNVSTWAIFIGKKEILASWNKNEMGDTVTIEKSKLSLTDELLAQRFLCGYSGRGGTTTLTIKNSNNEQLAEVKNSDNKMMYSASLPIWKIMNSKVKTNDVLSVYLSIKMESEETEYPVLLGNLKLK